MIQFTRDNRKVRGKDPSPLGYKRDGPKRGPRKWALLGITFNIGAGTFRRAMVGLTSRPSSSDTRATGSGFNTKTANSIGLLSGAAFNIGGGAFRRVIIGYTSNHQVRILGRRGVLWMLRDTI